MTISVPHCSSHLDGIGKMDTGGTGAKSVGGPPVHGLYDHHSASPAKASTPLMRAGTCKHVLMRISCVHTCTCRSCVMYLCIILCTVVCTCTCMYSG